MSIIGTQPVCYLRGTEIRTTETGRRVECLKIGDLVYTLSGESKPIKWIGHQQFTRNAGSAWPKSVLPVRVSRFALDEHTPNRDLYVSPNHGLLLDGVLIPAIKARPPRPGSGRAFAGASSANLGEGQSPRVTR
jgi:hypothetical protein